MATVAGTNSESVAASEALRRLYGDLVRMLQDPEQLACDLYAEGIVPEKAVDDMNVTGIPDKEKRMKLLSFVKDSIAVKHTRLQEFVQILKRQPPMVDVAERLEERYRTLTAEPTIQPHTQDQSRQPPSGNTAIETYASYLMFDVYLRQKFPTYGKWPPNTSKKYINLALIKKQRMSKEEMDHFTRQTIRGDIDDIVHDKESIRFEEIGKAKGNILPKCILVDGAPGVGKSTFAWKLCRKWSKGKLLQKYRLVVLLRLRDKRVREAKTVSDLFYYYNRPIQQAVVEEIQATGGRGVFLLFEGYDELPAKLRTSTCSSIFLDVIKGQELPSATVLVTSRPSASGPLYVECRDYITQHVEILGFTHENIESYLESTTGHKPSLFQGLQKYLSCYPHIRSMLYIPLNCAIVVEVYRVNKRDKSIIPKTWTDLYSSLLRSLLFRYLDDHPIHQRQSWKSNRFCDLPVDVYKQLCELGRIAYTGILQDQQVIFSDLPTDFNGLGLMQCVPELYVDDVSAESFNFLHLTLQEYMAALYLSERPIEKQTELFQKYSKSLATRFVILGTYQESDDKSNTHFRIVLRFLAGLRKFDGYSISSIRSLLHNIDVPSLSIDSGSSSSYSNLPISLDGLHWIFEAQDTGNVCEAIGKSVATVKISRTATSFDCFVLGYCVFHSNCPWEIDLFTCGIGDEGMEMFIRGAVEGEAKYSGYISQICISGSNITSAGIDQLLKMPELSKIRNLNLSKNPLCRGGAVSLLKSPFAYKLQVLTMSSTGIGVEDCHALSELLSLSPTLQSISINNNALPPEAIELIISGLKHHNMLEWLDIGGSQFNLQNCISLASVTQPPRHLNLQYCRVDDEGAMKLAGLLDQNTVSSLLLQDNLIGIKGATAFAKRLPQTTSLKKLSLASELIGLDGTRKLIVSLSQNSSLQELILPQQYKSSFDTSEEYRRVKGRIKWTLTESGQGSHTKSLALGKHIQESWDHDSIKQAEAQQLKECGTVYFKEENFDLALKFYNRGAVVVSEALKEEKEALKGIRVALHLNMAICHLKLKQPNLAIKDCEEVLKLDQSSVKAFYRRGQARQLLRDYDKAIADFQEVQKLEPNNKAPKLHITQCRNKIKAIHDQERLQYTNMFQRHTSMEKIETPSTKDEPKPGDLLKTEGEEESEADEKSWSPTP